MKSSAYNESKLGMSMVNVSSPILLDLKIFILNSYAWISDVIGPGHQGSYDLGYHPTKKPCITQNLIP